MNQETSNELRKMEQLLRKAVKSKEIPFDEFNKGMMVLAFRYADAGDTARAVEICGEIPDAYYDSKLAQHMKDDEKFGEMAHWLSSKVREYNTAIFNGSPVPKPQVASDTQPAEVLLDRMGSLKINYFKPGRA